MVERTTNSEVVGVVDRRFRAKGLILFVVLLDPRLLVVHVERRDDTFGEDPGAELAGRVPRDAAIEDQLHLIGPAEVEILAHHFFEEAAPGAWSIEDLERFWHAVWSFCGVEAATQGDVILVDRHKMPGARWFPEARLNFAENLLRRGDEFGFSFDNLTLDFGKAIDRSRQVVTRLTRGVGSLLKKQKVDVIIAWCWVFEIVEMNRPRPSVVSSFASPRKLICPERSNRRRVAIATPLFRARSSCRSP